MEWLKIRDKKTGRWLKLNLGIQINWLQTRGTANLFEPGSNFLKFTLERLQKEEPDVEPELVPYKERKGWPAR